MEKIAKCSGIFSLCNDKTTNCFSSKICDKCINPNRGGGRLNQDIRWEIGCNFSQEPPRDLKILDSFKNDVRPRLRESF